MNSKSHGHHKTVLISGAAGGLGSALVKIFANNGCFVIAADIHWHPSDTDNNHNISRINMDVTKPEQINTLVTDYNLREIGLDILVSAAGIYDTYPLTEANPELFKKMIEVNLLGTANLIQGLLVPLIKNKGRVIVVSSESYKLQAMFQPYMISKASLEAYCLVARQELALKGVRLTVIRPGAINTPLLKWMKSPGSPVPYPVYQKELKRSWKSSVKMVGKVASPEHVAKKIFTISSARKLKRVYRVNNSNLLSIISILPKSLFDWLVIRMFREKA
jgi:NAD(P)-dependent dehydrogenase (short-subunit alcohol dehydrogenase family)